MHVFPSFMTTSIILYTSLDQTKVLEAIRKVGFKEPTRIGPLINMKLLMI